MPTSLLFFFGLASILVFLGGVWVAHKLQQTEKLTFLGASWLQTSAQMLYFLGIPYLTLILGLIPARFFGLRALISTTDPNSNQSILNILERLLTQTGDLVLAWLPDLGSMAPTSALLGAIFILYTWFYLQALRGYLRPANPVSSPAKVNGAIDSEPYFSPMLLYPSKTWIIFDIAHWAFYRAIAWFVLGTIYLGIFGGLVLILVEYTLASRLSRFSTAEQQRYLFRFGLGLVTSIIFLFTPNVWLILIFQTVLVIMTEGLFKVVGNFSIAPA